MSSFKEVAIGDLFDLKNGSAKYVRSYVDAFPGKYPVYSAAVSSPFGMIASYDFQGPHLTWVMNGYGGRVLEVDGKFSANRDRGVLVPKKGVKSPDLTYIRQELEPVLREMAVGRRVDGRLNEYTKIYPPLARTAMVRLPLTDDGDIDYERMTQIGDRLRRVEAATSVLSSVLDDLDRASLTFECPEPYIDVSLGDRGLFELTIGSRLLLKDQLPSGVPAYSANVFRPFGFVAETKLMNFTEPSLLWGIDGNFGWNLIEAGQQFEITDHCGRLQIKNKLIDPLYALVALRATADQHGFDRVYRASLTNVRRDVIIRIPTDDSGSFSLERQATISRHMQKMVSLKVAAVEAISDVTAAKLSAVAA